MSAVSLRSSARAEWIKYRSVPSTLYGMITMVALSVGLGALINWAAASRFSHMPPERRLGFDPLAISLVGVFFAQFVVGVLGAMFITNEYSTASIRTTLAAVPRRTLLVASKVLVMLASLVVVCEAIVFLAFSIDQAILRSGSRVPYDTFATPGALRAVALAGAYLVLLGGLGFGFGLLLRKTPAAIVVFVVVQLIAPILVNFLPSDWSGAIMRFMPSELGIGMMSANQAPGTYGPWSCLLLLTAYVVALIAAGTVLLNRRDA